jgi:glyceraldehyde-3-phosphate dehydrogenase type I
MHGPVSSPAVLSSLPVSSAHRSPSLPSMSATATASSVSANATAAAVEDTAGKQPEPICIGINGFGRIGRLVFRATLRPELKGRVRVTAVNDPFLQPDYMAYLLKYDSTHGQLKGIDVKYDAENLIVGGHKVRCFAEKEPEKIAWADFGADYVCESTGVFRDKKGCSKHLTGKKPAKKVIISAPAKDDSPMFVMGVNQVMYTTRQHTAVVGWCG